MTVALLLPSSSFALPLVFFPLLMEVSARTHDIRPITFGNFNTAAGNMVDLSGTRMEPTKFVGSNPIGPTISSVQQSAFDAVSF